MTRVLGSAVILVSTAVTAQVATAVNPAQPDLLQRAILSAYRAGQHRIVIPPGVYLIKPQAEDFHLQFRNLSDFEIDARGADWVFTDQTLGGIDFRDCRNVRFRGATLRYEVPPFTQAVVEAIAFDGAWYDIRIEKGYPTNFDDRKYFPAEPIGYLFDSRTRLWKPGTYDLNGNRIERRGPDRFRVYWNRAAGSGLHPVVPGDLMAFRGSGPHNLTIVNSERMDITGVTIYNAANFAIWEFDGEGGNHYTVTVKRGPRPAGASTDPLLSSTADAFHSTNVRKGPVLDHCDLEGMADDGIAIHGTYSFVFQATDNKLTINNNSYRPGDPVRLLDPVGSPAGEAVVKGVRRLPNFESGRKSQRVTRLENTKGPFFEITADRSLKAGFDYLATNPSASGSGYELRHNTIRNHRARGMLLKADNGLVEDNIIEGSTMGGIVLSPELWWNEASYSRNVILRNNTIRHVAYAPSQLGAVLVATTEGTPVAGCGHRHIVVDGNRFENLNGVNLLISSACDVTVTNNYFLHSQQAAVAAGGSEWGEQSTSLIVVTQARGVRFGGNIVSAPGPFNKKLIDATPTAQVEGAGGGVQAGHP